MTSSYLIFEFLIWHWKLLEIIPYFSRCYFPPSPNFLVLSSYRCKKNACIWGQNSNFRRLSVNLRNVGNYIYNAAGCSFILVFWVEFFKNILCSFERLNSTINILMILIEKKRMLHSYRRAVPLYWCFWGLVYRY